MPLLNSQPSEPSDEQLLALAQKHGVQVPGGSAASEPSDEQLLALAQKHGVEVPPERPLSDAEKDIAKHQTVMNGLVSMFSPGQGLTGAGELMEGMAGKAGQMINGSSPAASTGGLMGAENVGGLLNRIKDAGPAAAGLAKKIVGIGARSVLPYEAYHRVRGLLSGH